MMEMYGHKLGRLSHRHIDKISLCFYRGFFVADAEIVTGVTARVTVAIKKVLLIASPPPERAFFIHLYTPLKKINSCVILGAPVA
jgi:hypothetical protein